MRCYATTVSAQVLCASGCGNTGQISVLAGAKQATAMHDKAVCGGVCHGVALLHSLEVLAGLKQATAMQDKALWCGVCTLVHVVLLYYSVVL